MWQSPSSFAADGGRDELFYGSPTMNEEWVLQEKETRRYFSNATWIPLRVIARLREDFPEIGNDPDLRTVFLKLRELRNSW